MVKSISWDIDKVSNYLNNYSETWARCNLPRGAKTILRKELGILQGKCFPRCLQIAHSNPDKFWYAEGFGIINKSYYPHAWLVPKIVKDQPNDMWCLDPTWPWKVKKDGKLTNPLDKIEYIGIKTDPIKTVKKLRELKGSCSLFKMIDQWDLEELL